MCAADRAALARTLENTPQCIYCPNPADGREHWLPRSLGTFGPLQVLSERICGECNGELGRLLDEEFARVGPEATLMAGHGMEGRHGSRRSPFYYRAATTQPLRAVDANREPDEVDLLFETIPDETGQPSARLLEQLVVKDETGVLHAVPFNIDWSPVVLREALRSRGLADVQLEDVYLDAEKLERARPVLTEVFPGFTAQHYGRSGAGRQHRTLRFEHTIGPAYFRAIAKVAFHAALRFVPHLSGHDWEVNSIREFVRRGQLPKIRPVRAAQERMQIIGGELGDLRLEDRHHVVIIHTSYRFVDANIRFFAGPGADPQKWLVRIGRRPDSVAADVQIALDARYFAGPAEDGHDGELVVLSAAELVELEASFLR